MKTIYLLLALFILSACTQIPTNEDTVRIGAVLPLTGWGAYWGIPAQQGATLALEDINATYNEAPVLFVEDSQSTPKDAATATQKLITIDNVDALYIEFSGPSVASSPIAEQYQKLLIYDAFAPTVVNTNQYAFKMYFDPKTECTKMMQYASSKGYKKIAGVMMLNDFSPPCKEAIKEQGKQLSITYEFYDFDIAETDFRTTLTKIKRSDANAILLLGYEDHSLNLLKQQTGLGMNVPIFSSMGDAFTEKVLQEAPTSQLEGSYAFDLEVNKEFAQRYLNLHPNASGAEIQAAASGYDAINYIYLASRNCPEKNVSCMSNSLLAVQYSSKIESENFGNDRIMKIKSKPYVYTNGRFEPLS